MWIIDVNVLLDAVNAGSRRHGIAHRWLSDALSGHRAVGASWVTLIGFVRLSTHRSVFPRPLSTTQALDQIDEWLDQPVMNVVEPTRRHAALLRRFLANSGTSGNLATDAHLAALAIEHDAEIISFDRDFGRFAGVRWRLPGA